MPSCLLRTQRRLLLRLTRPLMPPGGSQGALKERSGGVCLLGRQVAVDANAGIFVTLNPAGKGYGGRSKLPDNLKQLFRWGRLVWSGCGPALAAPEPRGCWAHPPHPGGSELHAGQPGQRMNHLSLALPAPLPPQVCGHVCP
jgi:hypothetical protein